MALVQNLFAFNLQKLLFLYEFFIPLSKSSQEFFET